MGNNQTKPNRRKQLAAKKRARKRQRQMIIAIVSIVCIALIGVFFINAFKRSIKVHLQTVLMPHLLHRLSLQLRQKILM